MEVQESSEVPNLKVGTRSRSNSKELTKNDTETSEDASANLTKNSDADLPNGAEHNEISKHEEEEEDTPTNMETDETEEVSPSDENKEVSPSDENNDFVAGEVSNVEPVKDSSIDEVSVEQPNFPIKEENCDIDVKEEPNFDDGGESDSSSENWNLNIDTSGSSAPSEQAGSEREDVGEECGSVNKETAVQDDEEYHSDESESFLGFVEETSDVHSMLQNIIAKLELEDSPSDEQDDEHDWDSSIETGDDQKLATDANHDILNTSSETPRLPHTSSKESLYRLPARLDGGNPADMVASDDVTSSSPSLSSGVSVRGKKVHVDLSNPAFRKPMEYGWKRELVYRNTSDSSGLKRMADIYYYTPLGKKVRSNREVIENLVGEDLTLDNFTFFKEPLGLDDPTKEIIRVAKRVATKEAFGAPPKKLAKPSKTTPTKEPKEPKEPTNDAATPEQQEHQLGKPVVVMHKIAANIPSPKEPSPVPGAAAPTPKPKPASRAFPRVKVTPVRSQRKSQNVTPNTTPTSKTPTSSRSKKDPNTSGELVMGMLPPQWKDPTSVPNKKSTSLTPGSTNTSPQVSPAPPAGAKVAVSSKTSPKSSTTKEVISEEVRAKRIESERQFMQFFMQNLGAGYTALGQVFQYLKVQELLRAGRVCRMWKDLASQASLWRTVRMKNSQVVNWKGCADALRRYGTEELDLRKMLIPGKAIAMWDEFCSVVGTIPSLRRLELCKCPADVLDRIAAQCPQLQSLTALSVKCSAIDLQFAQNFKSLQELRLKSIQGIDLMCSLDVLKNLTNLKHLSLTTFKEFGRKNPNVIGSITSLESLELGDFCDFPDSFGQSLSNLTNLQRLRLEKGQGKMCPTFKVLAGIRTLPRLTQLELVNFDIKPGFDVALEQCTNIRRLLIIPTYVSQSATTNHMVLGGVTKLGGSLVDFVWGVTHELLRVTELFVDQCEGQKGARVAPKDNKKNGTSDSIPVLKPVPGLVIDPLSENGSDNKGADSKQKAPREEISDENKTSAATQQVDILPLSKLQMLLTNALPNTKVKILKIPFHATWRQSIGEHSH